MSGSSDISPRAKVSYDQEKFMVEFSVQDYTPEVGLIAVYLVFVFFNRNHYQIINKKSNIKLVKKKTQNTL